MPTPAWWLSLMTTTVMWSLLTWWWPLQWSQYDAARSMLVDDVHGALEMLMTLMVPWWYGWWWWEMVELWWCSLEMPCWCLMSSQYSLMHVVGSHAIWCLGAMGLAHDGGVMIAWWWVSAMMAWYIHVMPCWHTLLEPLWRWWWHVWHVDLACDEDTLFP